MKNIREAVVKLIDLYSNSVDHISLKSKSETQYAGDSETDSHQSTVIADLDSHISITQAQIAHLKKAGGIRFIVERAEVYRPNKAARKKNRKLTDRLTLLQETRRKAKSSERPQPNCPTRKSAPYHNLNITNLQWNPKTLAATVSKVLLIAEQTDISLKKWIEETDRDPELNLLRLSLTETSIKYRQSSTLWKRA